MTKDRDRQPRPLATGEVEPLLPRWLDRSAHESAMLDHAMKRFAMMRRSGDVEVAFMEAMVICEYIAGAYVLAGRPDQPATQQIADAWFHKAELYVQWVTSWMDDKPKDIVAVASARSLASGSHSHAKYLAAAESCIRVALSNPEFVGRRYGKLQTAIKGKAAEKRGGSR